MRHHPIAVLTFVVLVVGRLSVKVAGEEVFFTQDEYVIMNPLIALPARSSDRKSRLHRQKTPVASRLGLRSLRLETLEDRQLLSVIPLLNGNFQSPTWVSNDYVNWTQQAVAPGTQAPNYNQLDPRFGVSGWGKTAEAGGGPGPNGEGEYSEHNDLGYNQYFNYVSGQLPAPASGVNFFCLMPAPNATYHFWIDQQPNTTGDTGNHNDIHFPPMIAATVAQAGETYQVTVALGNPLVNSGNSFPNVELGFTLGAGTFYEPSGTNSYNYAAGQTASPQSGDSSLYYNAYGTTVANTFTTGSSWQIAPGTFKDLTLTWTCPPIDNGMPLDIQLIYHGVSQTTCMSNVRLSDITTSPAPPSNLIAAGASTSQVNLSWTDNATNVTGFQIDQSTSSDFSTGVTTTTVGVTTPYYSATGLSSNTTYYYRVRAYNGGGVSANTATMIAATAGTTGTPVAIPVPDGNFTDAANYYINSNSGGNLTFTSPMTGTLSGWSLSASPTTANGGSYSGWEPYGAVDSVTSSGSSPYSANATSLGNQPGSSYNAFMYYPGEAYGWNTVVAGPPGAA